MARNNPAAALCTGPVVRLTVESVDPIGQRYQVILDYMAPGPLGMSPAIVNAFITSWQANAEVLFSNVLASDVTISRYTGAEVEEGTCPTVVRNVSVAGTVAGNSLPGTVAAVTTKYTGLKGQHGRGRVYYGAIPISFATPATDPNLLNAGAIAAYVNLNVGIITPVVAGGLNWALCVTTRPVPPATLVARAAVVTSLLVQPNMANVRRRREGRGI